MCTQGTKLAKTLVSETIDEFSHRLFWGCENSRTGHVIDETAITEN